MDYMQKLIAIAEALPQGVDTPVMSPVPERSFYRAPKMKKPVKVKRGKFTTFVGTLSEDGDQVLRDAGVLPTPIPKESPTIDEMLDKIIAEAEKPAEPLTVADMMSAKEQLQESAIASLMARMKPNVNINPLPGMMTASESAAMDPAVRQDHVDHAVLDKLGAAYHKNAVDHGWWDDDPAKIKAMGELGEFFTNLPVVTFTGEGGEEGDWRLINLPKAGPTVDDILNRNWPERSVGELLMLVVTEIAEAYEEYRDGKFDEVYYAEGSTKPEGGPIEMSDAIIRILELAHKRGWRMGAATKTKADYNKGRPYRHGGKLA